MERENKDRKMKIKPRFGDFIIIGVVLVTAVLSFSAFFYRSGGEPTAIIIMQGEVIQKINLVETKEHYEIKNIGKYNSTIEVENGRIRFKQSDCPNKVCVQTGWISRPGQTAVCLPAEIIIKIIGENNDVDIIMN